MQTMLRKGRTPNKMRDNEATVSDGGSTTYNVDYVLEDIEFHSTIKITAVDQKDGTVTLRFTTQDIRIERR